MKNAIFGLKRRVDFLRIQASRKKYITPRLIVHTAMGVRNGDVRVGFTASRKVGGAFQRNRARRRLRAAVHTVLLAFAKPGCDYVLIARPDMLTCSFDDLTSDLMQALRSIHESKCRHFDPRTSG